jgi:hypothetical protein
MQLFANPYDTSATGFYFETAEEYAERYVARLPVEEYEIEFIDGDGWQSQIFAAADPRQGDIANFFALIDDLEGMSDEARAGAWFRMSNNGDKLKDVVESSESDHVDYVLFSSGAGYEAKALTEYAEHLVDEGAYGEIPKALEYYINCEAIGRDLRLNGDVSAEEFDGTYYIFNNYA